MRMTKRALELRLAKLREVGERVVRASGEESAYESLLQHACPDYLHEILFNNPTVSELEARIIKRPKDYRYALGLGELWVVQDEW